MADPIDQKVSVLTSRPVISPTDILLGVASPTLAPASVAIPVSAFDNRYQQVFNPLNYGAKGDNSTDDTTAVQATINAAHAASAGGGFIFLPAFFKITKALTLYSDIAIKGIGMEISGIRQVTAGEDVLYGIDCSSIVLEDFSILGNGTGSSPGSNGCGINLDWSAAGNNPFHNFRNLLIKNNGSDGVRIKTAIVSGFDKIYVAYNGNHGFNWYQGGTSCNFKNCWARQNSGAGYRFKSSVYQSLTGCAADNNGVGYLVQDAQSIGFFGCGAEGQLKNNATYNGFGWQIDDSSVIDLRACWITDNRNLGVWVTNGSNGVGIQVADNTPNATAAYFIQVDSGCVASIYDLHNTTANKIDGTAVIINDGAGGNTAKTLSILGANGTLKLSADTDGGQYNIFSNNGNQTLAFYGSGSNVLNLELLDGNLTLDSGKLIVSTGNAPANAASTGVAGQFGWDGSNLYLCVSANTWKKVGIATF